ncbi:unnamed protein product, partial [Didymodactylos carnosus]
IRVVDDQQNTTGDCMKVNENISQPEDRCDKTSTEQTNDQDKNMDVHTHSSGARKPEESHEENDPHMSSPYQTRSKSHPKLTITFPDSSDDDEMSTGKRKRWSFSFSAKSDISNYRRRYPDAKDDKKLNDNYRFYTNQIRSYPDGDYIDEIHVKWYGQFEALERHHGYIQWLFPLQEQGLNWSAQPLQKHEIELILNDKTAHKRLLRSYTLMLNFYGFELVNDETGEIKRNEDYRQCFRNLNTSSHNYLRITRILKCLGEFKYEHLKFGFLECILRESIIENTLNNCLRSCRDYWIETLRSKSERQSLKRYANELIDYRNKGILPPKQFRAERPPVAID